MGGFSATAPVAHPGTDATLQATAVRRYIAIRIACVVDTAWFMWSSLISLIGMAVFVYGRRQRRGTPFIVGVALMIYPYFVSSTWALVGIGALLLGGLVVGNRIEDGA